MLTNKEKIQAKDYVALNYPHSIGMSNVDFEELIHQTLVETFNDEFVYTRKVILEKYEKV